VALKKQAVVLIHGIGEQRPMNNLRAFVDTVWTTDLDVQHRWSSKNGVLWSKPHLLSENYELRRLTTSKSASGKRTDFFEFYWAHLMQGNEFRHIAAWAKVLLRRSPHTVPKPIRGLWFLAAIIAIIIPLGTAAGVIVSGASAPAWVTWTLGGVGALLWLLSTKFFVDRAGDAARYLDSSPPNIEVRHAIRSAGIEMLEDLHRSGKYDRIVIVGHSLGTVIGYDILSHLWGKHRRTPDGPAREGLDALTEASRKAPGSDDFRAAQVAYRQELQGQGVDWLVSDFVTLGSPLTYAAFLLASNHEDFERRVADRELPVCPPVPDGDDITYQPWNDAPPTPHHAAVFGPTRWTNVYFRPRWTVYGDVISGPLAPVLGPGIRDVEVSTTRRGGFLTHTLYWSRQERGAASVEPHIAALRSAINLLDQDEGEDDVTTEAE
jgi:hypothetical protein